MKVYDGIMKGLEEAAAYQQGKIKARSKVIEVAPVPNFQANDIKNIRSQLSMTQVVFAELMGVSTKTVEAWESGRNVPDGPARRMLTMLKADPSLPQKFKIVSF